MFVRLATLTLMVLTPMVATAQETLVPAPGAAFSAPQTSAPTTTPSPRPHEVGLGGKAGGFSFGIGGSARMWQSEKVGLQVDLSHYRIGAVNLLQVAPSVLFVLGEPDLDRPTQVRPYVGGGLNILRASYASLGSESGIGGQGFVGAEIVFEGMPRFGLSGDIGYYSTGNFAGVNFGGFGLSVAGHYYIR